MKSLIFALLLNVIFVSSDSRDGIVHDLVDDFDVDEFDLDGLDPSFASASFNAGSEDFDQKDTKVDNDDDDDDEEEDEDNSWDDEDVQDLDDDSNDFGDDDEDDEFAAPKKKIKKKQIKKKNNKNKKIEKNKKNKRKKASTKSSKFTNPMLTSPRSYIGEYIAMVLIILYAMMYFIGSSQNEQRATSFMEAFYPVVRDQFHTVGEDRMLLTDNHTDLTKWEARKLLTKESQSQYRLYATGRKQVKGMIVDLKLVDRQDLFSTIASLLTGQQDMVSLDISLDQMASFVLAIVPVKDGTKYRELHGDIKELTSEQKQWRKHLPNSLELFTDSSYSTISSLLLSKDLLKKEAKELLTSPYFYSLHFTDMSAPTTEPLIQSSSITSEAMMNFTFILPTDVSEMNALCSSLMTLVFDHYVNKISSFTLDRAASIKAKTLRNKVKEKIFSDVKDERETRKELRKENKDKERTEKLEKMSDQARAKFLKKEEDKQRKRRMKRGGGKMRIAM